MDEHRIDIEPFRSPEEVAKELAERRLDRAICESNHRQSEFFRWCNKAEDMGLDWSWGEALAKLHARGWTVEHHMQSPPEARYYTERDGVGYCAPSLEDLRTQIERVESCKRGTST